MPVQTGRCPNCFGAMAVTPCSYCGWQVGQDNPPPALALERVLDGRYRVGRVLGHGGFGITYLAWDDNLHLRLAIKEYFPRDSAGRGMDGVSLAVYSGPAGEQFTYGLERFLEEARTLAQLDHPNIVRVRNFFEANGTAYLVMDYYQGLSLAEYLDQQGGRLAEEQARKLMLPILDGLRAVHAKGFLHRDIKPQNLYLARLESGGVRPILLDFGTARQAMGERSRSLSVVLTPGYAPFEQYHRKGKQGPWTDVYAAAAVLYRMVTGVEPPEATERREADELKPATSFGVSRALSDALGAGLAIVAEARPQTVQAFHKLLTSDMAATSPQPRPAPALAPDPRPRQELKPPLPGQGVDTGSQPDQGGRQTKFSLLGLTVLLAAAGGGGYWLAQPSEPTGPSSPQPSQMAPPLTSSPAPTSAPVPRPNLPPAAPPAPVTPPVTDPPSTAPSLAGRKIVAPQMVTIPAGSFLMGSPTSEPEREVDEGPQHLVKVAAFELGKAEVTFDEWDACVAAGGCQHEPGDAGWGRGQRPVINVSWNDAHEYVRWLSRETGMRWRLPTEAEWEYAGRAGTRTPFSTGACISTRQANYNGNSDYNDCGAQTGVYVGKTQPVGSYPANPWGLYEMQGNVWEWVEDCWHDSYQGVPMDGSAWTQGACPERVVRGGSWGISPRFLRSADRYRSVPGNRGSGNGFRVARTLTPEPFLAKSPNHLTQRSCCNRTTNAQDSDNKSRQPDAQMCRYGYCRWELDAHGRIYRASMGPFTCSEVKFMSKLLPHQPAGSLALNRTRRLVQDLVQVAWRQPSHATRSRHDRDDDDSVCRSMGATRPDHHKPATAGFDNGWIFFEQ